MVARPPKAYAASLGGKLSPGRAELKLTDLVSDNPQRIHAIQAPSPPRAVPHLSNNDTDAAIQILETSIRQLDARLLNPRGVLASLPSSCTDKPTLPSTSSRLDIPTYLATVENDIPTEMTKESSMHRFISNDGEDLTPAVHPPAAQAAPVEEYTAGVKKGMQVRARARAMQNLQSYDRGMSPALGKMRNVYLDGSNNPTSERKIMAVSIGDYADKAKARVPLISQLDTREGWKAMVMAEWEMQERNLEFAEEEMEQGVGGEGGASAETAMPTEDLSTRRVDFSPSLTLLAVPESSEDDCTPVPVEESILNVNHVADSVHQKPKHSTRRRPHTHRRLPQASLDALSGGKNIFQRVAGSYSKRVRVFDLKIIPEGVIFRVRIFMWLHYRI